MEYILIADAGSTKIEWAIISSDGETIERNTSKGINALISSQYDMISYFQIIKPAVGDHKYSGIFYYGAGCATPEICEKVRYSLSRVFKAGMISVSTDLLGAARALLGENDGVACILGTGSNSCLYDGNEITANIPPLGFILGDEGSGASLGKRLVGNVFKGLISEKLRGKFKQRFNLSLPELLDRVYRSEAPNRFLASLVPFLKENITDPEIHILVLEEFNSFIKRNLFRYPDIKKKDIAFTGSIALHFEDVLREAADIYGLRITGIQAFPMDGLIEYHTKRFKNI